MNADLKYFRVSPSVVPADRTSTVRIRSLDGIFRFYDDTPYQVQFIPMEYPDTPTDAAMTLLGADQNRPVFTVYPNGGVLELEHFFAHEQEWRIRVWCDPAAYAPHTNPLYAEYDPYWQWLIDRPGQGVYLSVYALGEELYGTRPRRADLHLHTTGSDGSESPALVAARYRGAGYDAIAVTDHNRFDTAAAAAAQLEGVTALRILRGEEVHNGYVGFFHVVNIGSRYSVNQLYLEQPERVAAETAALEDTVPVPPGVDAAEYRKRVWLYRAIKAAGGTAIYPHPYWLVGAHYHTDTAMSRAILQNGLCDAYEVYGGVHPEGMDLQEALYHEMRADGCDIPVVGSTDCHSVLKDGFAAAATVALCRAGESVIDAVLDHRSTAVQTLPGETPHVTGHLRAVAYTCFLLRTWFALHDELCGVAGRLLEDVAAGDDSAIPAVQAAEARLAALEKEFFGA